jgi:hypothetical protein
MTSLFIAGQISVFRITKCKINNYLRKIFPEELIKKCLFYEARMLMTMSTTLCHRTQVLSQNLLSRRCRQQMFPAGTAYRSPEERVDVSPNIIVCYNHIMIREL